MKEMDGGEYLPNVTLVNFKFLLYLQVAICRYRIRHNVRQFLLFSDDTKPTENIGIHTCNICDKNNIYHPDRLILN
jgi:hypothetical protein